MDWTRCFLKAQLCILNYSPTGICAIYWYYQWRINTISAPGDDPVLTEASVFYFRVRSCWEKLRVWDPLGDVEGEIRRPFFHAPKSTETKQAVHDQRVRNGLQFVKLIALAFHPTMRRVYVVRWKDLISNPGVRAFLQPGEVDTLEEEWDAYLNLQIPEGESVTLHLVSPLSSIQVAPPSSNSKSIVNGCASGGKLPRLIFSASLS